EKARQQAAALIDDADKRRRTAEAQAADAEKARQVAEKARQEAEAKAAGGVTSNLASPSGQFSQKSNIEAKGHLQYAVTVSSKVDCEQTCAAQSNNTCKVFSYQKKYGRCYNYSEADLYPNEDFDSGVLASSPFSRRNNIEVR